MKKAQIFLLLGVGILMGFALGRSAKIHVFASASKQQQSLPAVRVVDLKASDGVTLKASYFATGKPGPGVLLFHQNNRTRTSWDGFARQLAAAGFNTLTLDTRGFGESTGKRDDAVEKASADMETAFQFLISQPSVRRDAIGLAGAGSLGVVNAIETARMHPSELKSLVMISGDTFRPGVEFLHEASQLPELFVIADTDEYPPTVETMLWLYARASSPMRKLIHYSAVQEAPWLWYETPNPSRVPETGSHGTDLFKTHPDLPGMILQWFVTTLIKTPGHAPADPLAQLWPEVSGDIVGSGFLTQADMEESAGYASQSQIAERKTAIEIFQVNLLAYPDSADAHFNLADAYLRDGQKDLARQYAEKALAMLDSHAAPLSSWSDSEQRRAEIRKGIQDALKKLAEGNK